MLRSLFLIPARTGSRGVPGKNVHPFGGIPALGLRAIAAVRSRLPGEIVCSTDDQAYADVAIRYGARAPFLRPAELATATASSVDVALHALDWLAEHEGKTFDVLVLMEPSSPFCRPRDLITGMELLEKSGADSVVSVREVNPHPRFMAGLDANGRYGDLFERLKALKDVRRQGQSDTQYTPAGSFYAVRPRWLREQRAFYAPSTHAFVVDEFHGLEIDSEFDLILANAAWEHSRIETAAWLG